MTKLYALTIFSLLLAFQLGPGAPLLQQTTPTDSLTQKEVVNEEKVESPEKPVESSKEEKVEAEEEESWQLVIDLKNWKLELKKKNPKKN